MAGRIDMSRLAKLAQRPGVDPRVWLTLAVVEALGFDAAEGVFADVRFQPTGERETALVAVPYAGDGFGDWCPLAVDDVVLVAVPNGDPSAGPVIIARMWRAADRPPADVRAGQDDADGHPVPTADRVIRVQAGQRLVVRVSGSGGDVDIRVEGSGNVNLVVDSGKVLVGATSGGEPPALATTLKSYLDTVKTWLDAHVHPDPQGGSTLAPPVPSPSVPTIAATKVEVK